MISGYVYKYRGNYRSYIWKKAKRLMIPLLIWGSIDVALHTSSLANTVTLTGSSSFIDGIVGMLFRGEQLWFFYVLFGIFLVYPIIAEKEPVYKIGVALTCIAIDLLFDLPEILCINRIVYYLYYFIIGNVIRINWDHIREISKRWLYWGIAIILFLIYSFSVSYYMDVQMQPGVIKQYIVPLIMSVFIVLIVAAFAGKFRIIDDFLIYCSTFSAQLYIFQRL